MGIWLIFSIFELRKLFLLEYMDRVEINRIPVFTGKYYRVEYIFRWTMRVVFQVDSFFEILNFRETSWGIDSKHFKQIGDGVGG